MRLSTNYKSTAMFAVKTSGDDTCRATQLLTPHLYLSLYCSKRKICPLIKLCVIIYHHILSIVLLKQQFSND